MHIQLSNRSGANTYSVDPSGKHYADGHSSTKISCTVNFWLVLLSFQCPATKCLLVYVLIVDILLLHAGCYSHSCHCSQYRGAEVISGSKRLTVREMAIGQPRLRSEMPKCKQVKAWQKCIFLENPAKNLDPADSSHKVYVFIQRKYTCCECGVGVWKVGSVNYVKSDDLCLVKGPYASQLWGDELVLLGNRRSGLQISLSSH